MEVYNKYYPQGLEVLAFPCNQFGKQEPATNEEIKTFAAGFGVTFPMFAKIDVNGPHQIPLYKWLKEVEGGTMGDGIKWNFTKFLLNKDGVPVSRYAPTTSPNSIVADILKELAK